MSKSELTGKMNSLLSLDLVDSPHNLWRILDPVAIAKVLWCLYLELFHSFQVAMKNNFCRLFMLVMNMSEEAS